MKKILSLILLTCMIAGVIWVPASAASKESKVRIKGIIAPIEKTWVRNENTEEFNAYYDEKSGNDDQLFVIISESAVSSSAAKKLAGLLNKKSSKSKVCKAIKNLPIMEGAEFTKKDITLKKDSNGKYLAILNIHMDTENDYLVIRNIDDRFIVIYGVANNASVEVSSKIKKKVLKYAKKVVADEIGISVILKDEIVVPYKDEWTIKRYDEDDAESVLFSIGPECEIGMMADFADCDEETVKIAELIKDKSKFEELKALMIDLLGIPLDDMEDYPFEVTFAMESDGHGSNDFIIDAGAGIVVIRIIDEKYVIMCEALDYTYNGMSEEMKNSVIKLVNDAFLD